MLSIKTKKFLKSLQIKKYRSLEQCFMVEGVKNVLEAMKSDWKIRILLATDAFLKEHEESIRTRFPVERVSEKELTDTGSFQSNNSAIAVLEFKTDQPEISKDEFTLAFDEIKDPGNLGTVIRIADWYGLNNIICSDDSVDFYNPKVINASMGSFLRVRVNHTNLSAYLKSTDLPVYGFYLGGDNVHKISSLEPGILLFGNESRGINDAYERLVSRKLSIPKFGQAESLNVAVSAAVALDNIVRLK